MRAKETLELAKPVPVELGFCAADIRKNRGKSIKRPPGGY